VSTVLLSICFRLPSSGLAEGDYRCGDCGFEDADANLELVEGNGVARQHAADESPSALAAPIHVTLPEEE